jgi:MFS family permease
MIRKRCGDPRVSLEGELGHMAQNTDNPADTMTLWAQLRSYPAAFWYANGMEMIERWAYYGVRLVLALYIVGATAQGGLEFNHIQKGNIYLWWAIIASFLPMFTGGFADRYGYKKTIAVAVVLKILGYGLMATQRDYWGFFTGCMLLASGTGLFKPGVQGLIAHSVHGKNASVGWGVFYELVNFGAFLGGVLATPLRDISWSAVFYFNTALVALNFLPLLMFKEPEVDRPAPHSSLGAALQEVVTIFVTSIRNIFEPRLFVFILIFSGFWFSFHQLFDLLPNFIDDWTSASTTPAMFLTKSGHVAAEQILNINSFMILLVMIPVAYIASRFRPLIAIIFGIIASIIGILVAGSTMSGYACLAGVIIFTFGEMLASPRTKDYMAMTAPVDKKGLYLGYSEVPSGVGWALGSIFAGSFYEHHGDKVNFARQWLQDNGMSAEAVKAIPKDKVMETMAAQAQVSVHEATTMLWNLHQPATVWYIIAGVGVVSLLGMIAYHYYAERQAARAVSIHVA